MAKKNYEKLAKEIVRYIGGPENVNALVHCATRLRFKVKNTQNVDKKKLEQLEGGIRGEKESPEYIYGYDFWYLCTCTWCHEWCRYAESVVDFMYNFRLA